MLTLNLGLLRIGTNRLINPVCKKYFLGQSLLKKLQQEGKSIDQKDWKTQQVTGRDSFVNPQKKTGILKTVFFLSSSPLTYNILSQMNSFFFICLDCPPRTVGYHSP